MEPVSIKGNHEGTANVDEDREAVRKVINSEIKNAFDEELRKAVQELQEEQRKAIRQIIENQKMALRGVVEEEKKAIWARADEFKKSILNIEL